LARTDLNFAWCKIREMETCEGRYLGGKRKNILAGEETDLNSDEGGSKKTRGGKKLISTMKK